MKLRAAFLRRNPLCSQCKEQGKTELATDAHHVRKFHSLDDPLRLDPSNLIALCRRHHMQLEQANIFT
jgi:5-methylcytosine-specific restriction endonuclease McrA